MEKPPKKLDTEESFKQFLWNSETREVMGRTGSSWAKILGFYFIFYAALAAFFAILLAVFFQTLNGNEPKYKMEDLVGGDFSPGLGIRPMQELGIESAFSKKEAKMEITEHWISELDKFLKEYNEQYGKYDKAGEKRVKCSFDNPPSDGQVCFVNIKDGFENCTKEKNYGYPDSPCFFIKLNKIIGWKPEIYSETSVDKLPEDMPKDLKQKITIDTKEKMIWISCIREDRPKEEINYYPQSGLPGYYYPYENQKGYLSPLIAINIKNLKPDKLVKIECRAWAKNIKHDKANGRGIIRFQYSINNVMASLVGT